jgi:lipid II:glycine glycyltransferase (peptidoglycan interpeptide bridge formation enzyme)
LSQQETYRNLSKQLSLPVFFQPWWLDMMSPCWDAIVVEENGTVNAVWPFTLEKKMGFTLIRNPLLTPYLGPLFFLPSKEKVFGRWNQEDRIFQEFWKQLPALDFMEVMCVPGYHNFLPFHQNGFSHTQRITYHIDLNSSEENILQGMKSSQRAHIKQAAQDLIIEEGTAYLNEFCARHKNTFQRKEKRYLYSPAFLKKIIDTSIAQQAGMMLTALHADGGFAAGIFTVYDGNVIYLLLSAVNTERIHNGAVSLLIFEAMKRAKERNIKTFDFEGSMDAGIESFFRSFGGQRLFYLSCTKYNSKLWQMKRAMIG